MTNGEDEKEGDWWSEKGRMRTFKPPRNNARRNGEGTKDWWGNSDDEGKPPAESLTTKRNSMMATEQWWRESRNYESAANMNDVIAEIDTEDGTNDTEESRPNGIVCDLDEHCGWWSESLQLGKFSRDVTEFLNLNFNFQAETPTVEPETILQKRVSLDDVPIPLSSNDMFGNEDDDDDASTYAASTTTAVRHAHSSNRTCCCYCCCSGRFTAKDICVVLLHLFVVGMGATIVAFTSTDIKLLWQCFLDDGSDANDDDYYSYSVSMCQEDQLSLEMILIPILMFVAGATMVVCSSGYILLGHCCGMSIDCRRFPRTQNHGNAHNKHNQHRQGEC